MKARMKKLAERSLRFMSRCSAEHPEGKGRCGLPAGHKGRHTLLSETGAPWGVQFDGAPR